MRMILEGKAMITARARFLFRCFLFFLCLLWAMGVESTENAEKLFGDLGGVVTYIDDRPCPFEQGYHFCDVDYKGGGILYSSPGGRYLTLLRGIRHDDNPNPLPVTPWRVHPETCDSVIVVVNTDSCKVIRLINVDPGRGDPEDSYKSPQSFSRDDSFLVLRYTGGSSVIFQAPDFDPAVAVTLPYGVWPLGWLDDHRHYLIATNLGYGSGGQYRVLDVSEGGMKEVFKIARSDWGISLTGDPNVRGGPSWEAVFFDEEGFVVRLPGVQGGKALPSLEAYSFSGAPPGRIVLPSKYSDLVVKRIDGVLTCSWAADGRRFQRKFSPAKDKNHRFRYCWYPLWPDPSYFLDEQGELTRKSDGFVCKYLEKGAASTIEFLPYGHGIPVWTSPGGRYVALMGALKPEDNPNVGPCDRPGYFRMGYDSVVLLVDVVTCRLVRIVNIEPGESKTTLVWFSPDDSLAFVESSKRIRAFDAPSFGESTMKILPHNDEYIRYIEMNVGKVKGSDWIWWNFGKRVFRRIGGSLKEVPQIWDLLWAEMSKRHELIRLKYVDEDVAVFLGFDEEKGSFVSIVVPYGSGGPTLTRKLPDKVTDLTIERGEDGRLFCKYRSGKDEVSKILWQAPAAMRNTSPQEPEEVLEDR